MANIDESRPVLAQVSVMSIETYTAWIDSKKTYSSLRLFENDALEWFTKAEWWAPALYYGTLSFLMFILFVESNNDMSVFDVIGCVGLGWIVWWFMEYSIHRWLFHMKTYSVWMLSTQFLIHGLHHKTPNDKQRLVIHPLLSSLIAGPIALLVSAVFPSGFWHALMIGGLVNYGCVYEVCHYWTHHASSRTHPWIKAALDKSGLRKWHMAHHYKDSSTNYTISPNPLDYVFGTAAPT